MIIKGKLFIAIAAIAFFVNVCDGSVGITDIDVSPTLPDEFDPISLEASGWIGYAFYTTFDSSDYVIDGTDITLNHYFTFINPGMGFPVAGGWDKAHQIGTLSAGTYQVTAKTYENGGLTDSMSISFDVIPEPGTFTLLISGAFFLRKRIKRGE